MWDALRNGGVVNGELILEEEKRPYQLSAKKASKVPLLAREDLDSREFSRLIKYLEEEDIILTREDIKEIEQDKNGSCINLYLSRNIITTSFQGEPRDYAINTIIMEIQSGGNYISTMDDIGKDFFYPQDYRIVEIDERSPELKLISSIFPSEKIKEKARKLELVVTAMTPTEYLAHRVPAIIEALRSTR